ncbi:hypothetical protein HKCCE2091_01695 [Rhodobacterales bacterium HKCCE2091]|nr:hypothetical protein [Rhodobacterales bacterium HKCCE2091]
MSSSDRRRLILSLAALPLVAACGFRPVYGTGGPGAALRGRVRIDDPVTRYGFELVSRLEERLGRGEAASYRLGYVIRVTREGIAITGSNDITRIRVTGEADYALTELSSGVQRLAGRVTTFTAYSTTGSTLATDAAARDAEDRLMVLLADRIADELISGAARFAS